MPVAGSISRFEFLDESQGRGGGSSSSTGRFYLLREASEDADGRTYTVVGRSEPAISNIDGRVESVDAEGATPIAALPGDVVGLFGDADFPCYSAGGVPGSNPYDTVTEEPSTGDDVRVASGLGSETELFTANAAAVLDRADGLDPLVSGTGTAAGGRTLTPSVYQDGVGSVRVTRPGVRGPRILSVTCAATTASADRAIVGLRAIEGVNGRRTPVDTQILFTPTGFKDRSRRAVAADSEPAPCASPTAGGSTPPLASGGFGIMDISGG